MTICYSLILFVDLERKAIITFDFLFDVLLQILVLLTLFLIDFSLLIA